MILLVSGASASGKSEYAESRAMAFHKEKGGKLFYIATMMPFGEEAQARIERHHALRAGKGFETVERYTNLLGLASERPEKGVAFPTKARGSTILLECMSNLVANEIFDPKGAGPVGAAAVIHEGVHMLERLAENLIIVTIDVFGDGETYDPETEKYKQCLAAVNTRLAMMADEVEEVVYGIPVKIKG